MNAVQPRAVGSRKTADPPSAAEGLAEGFAHVLHQWAVDYGCAAPQAQAVAQAGRSVIQALQDGHVCVTVDAAVRPTLLDSGLVATPERRHGQPLVLDDRQRLYLHRDYEHEYALAHRVAAAVRHPPEVAHEIIPAPGMPALSVDQHNAVGIALTHRFSLISGGPGTGKTTTVVSLLYALLQREATLRIVLAAPTGKAAARLLDSVRSAAHAWPEALRERLPSQASTLHRLLGRGPRRVIRGASARPEPGSLAADVLIVDEASMVDLALARELLDAAAPSARLVLLGDKDQLSAVEAGAVFSELCASAPVLPGVAVLRHAFRFQAESSIPELAAAVLRGEDEPVLNILRSSARGVRWIPVSNGAARSLDDAQARAVWQEGFSAYQAAVRACWEHRDDWGSHVSAALQALGRFRVLCAVREGPWGVHAWNRQLNESLGMVLDPAAAAREQRWGQPIVIRHNDAELGLFNGDMGVLLPNAQGQAQAVFADTDPHSPGWRAIALAQLPAHEPAWAMTVHLAQGSEFDRVLLVLPSISQREAAGPGLTREWLYTAVTRAKRDLVVLSQPAAFQLALQQHRPRASGLRDQLRQALSGDAPNAPAAAADPSSGPR